MEIAGPKLKEMQAQRNLFKNELAEEPKSEKVIGLHPAALRHYEKCVTQLQTVFSGGVKPDTAEAAEAIRSLIANYALPS